MRSTIICWVEDTVKQRLLCSYTFHIVKDELWNHESISWICCWNTPWISLEGSYKILFLDIQKYPSMWQATMASLASHSSSQIGFPYKNTFPSLIRDPPRSSISCLHDGDLVLVASSPPEPNDMISRLYLTVLVYIMATWAPYSSCLIGSTVCPGVVLTVEQRLFCPKTVNTTEYELRGYRTKHRVRGGGAPGVPGDKI